MGKDKVVDLVKPADAKKALCTVEVTTMNGEDYAYNDVAGYQLIEGTLVILRHEGPTHLFPTSNIYGVTITANKE